MNGHEEWCCVIIAAPANSNRSKNRLTLVPSFCEMGSKWCVWKLHDQSSRQDPQTCKDHSVVASLSACRLVDLPQRRRTKASQENEPNHSYHRRQANATTISDSLPKWSISARIHRLPNYGSGSTGKRYRKSVTTGNTVISYCNSSSDLAEAKFSCLPFLLFGWFIWLIFFIGNPINRLSVPRYRGSRVSGKGVSKSTEINIRMPQRRQQRVPRKGASKEKRDWTRAVTGIGQGKRDKRLTSGRVVDCVRAFDWPRTENSSRSVGEYGANQQDWPLWLRRGSKNGVIWIGYMPWSSNFQGISRNYYSFWILVGSEEEKTRETEYQTKTGSWWETFRPLRGFFSLRLRDVSPSQGLLQSAIFADWRSPWEGETSLTNFPSLSDILFLNT